MNRIGQRGQPSDFQISRFVGNIFAMFPNLASTLIESDINRKFDHALYGLKPKSKLIQMHPMVNDNLPNRIASGRIKVKGKLIYLLNFPPRDDLMT